MCGRFALTADTAILRLRYRIATESPETVALAPRYNCAPMQRLPVILPESQDSGRWGIRLFQWGLIPEIKGNTTPNPSLKGGEHGTQSSPPVKGELEGVKKTPLINARCETITEKRSFSDSFRQRRCLIPADAYYEWSSVGNIKKAYRISIENEPLFSFAGIWDEHRLTDGSLLCSFALLTTDAIPALSVIHHRMPVILTPEQESQWLHPNTEISVLQSFFTPLPERHFSFYRVSDQLGNARLDHADLILPLPDVNQSALFG